jgi:Spy/CpxP family protein refolding chaperone
MKAMSLLALALVAAAPLAAQAPGHGTMRPGGMMHGPMMAGMDSMMAPVMADMPEHLLAQKALLHLTSAQDSQLTALRDAARASHDSAAKQAAMHLGEMRTVMAAAAPDTAAVRAHFDAAHQYMASAMWAMVLSAAEARAVLTDAQRTQLDAMARRPMRGMRHGGMGKP